MYTLSIGSYRQAPFVTGGMIIQFGLDTEILDYNSGKWNLADAYPSGNKYFPYTLIFLYWWVSFRISNYATVSTDKSVYVIGGFDNFALPRSKTSAIKEFTDNRWRHAGDLAKARSYHSAISFGGKVLIVGGEFKDTTM